MPICYTCRKQLTGTWNMTESSETFKETGRYLGITDGYFLYGGTPYWVQCYCKTCWEKQILSLPFVSCQLTREETKQQLEQKDLTINSLNSQIAALTTEKNNLVVRYSALNIDITTRTAEDASIKLSLELEVQRLKQLLDAKDSEINSLKEKLKKAKPSVQDLDEDIKDFKELNPSMNVYRKVKEILSYQDTIAKEKYISTTLEDVQTSLRTVLNEKQDEWYKKLKESLATATNEKTEGLLKEIDEIERMKILFAEQAFKSENIKFDESELKAFNNLYDKKIGRVKQQLFRCKEVKYSMEKLHDARDDDDDTSSYPF